MALCHSYQVSRQWEVEVWTVWLQWWLFPINYFLFIIFLISRSRLRVHSLKVHVFTTRRCPLVSTSPLFSSDWTDDGLITRTLNFPKFSSPSSTFPETISSPFVNCAQPTGFDRLAFSRQLHALETRKNRGKPSGKVWRFPFHSRKNLKFLTKVYWSTT